MWQELSTPGAEDSGPLQTQEETRWYFHVRLWKQNHRSLLRSGLSPGPASYIQEGTTNTGKTEKGVRKGVLPR